MSFRINYKNLIENPFSKFEFFVKKGTSYLAAVNHPSVDLSHNLTIAGHLPEILVLFAR